VALSFTGIPQLARNAGRLREVVTVLGKYGLADWLSRLDWEYVQGLLRRGGGQAFAPHTHAERVRLALTELGTTFIKLGQMLSTRSDLVGPELAHELTALQSSVPADPPSVARQTVEGELGRPVADLFAAFDDVPVASASIGQVHRATLPDGRAVAVKVQHPGIAARVRTDLAILAGFAELAERLPDLRTYQPRAVVAEFHRSLLRELDFSREERHLQQFGRAFARASGVRFPAPEPGLCTPRVLTMEWVGGVPLSRPEQLRAAGHDLPALARRGAMLFLDMIFGDGLYHADPHPGNVLVLPDGTLGVIDAGMVGRLDEPLRDDLEALLLGLVRDDPAALAGVVLRIGRVPPGLDPAALGADVTEFLADYRGVPLDRFDVAGALTEMLAIVRRYRVVLPTAVAMLLKVLIELEGTARLLDPRFNLIEVMQPYQRKLVARRLSPARRWRKLRRYLAEWEAFAAVLPRQLADLLRRGQDGRFAVVLRHERLDPAVNRVVFALVTCALFVGSALMWGLRAPPTVWEVSVPGLFGCAISVLMSLRLFRAVFKSGRLDRGE
jgi:ubiquinone biosynthesis protein